MLGSQCHFQRRCTTSATIRYLTPQNAYRIQNRLRITRFAKVKDSKDLRIFALECHIRIMYQYLLPITDVDTINCRLFASFAISFSCQIRK